MIWEVPYHTPIKKSTQVYHSNENIKMEIIRELYWIPPNIPIYYFAKSL
jgi:hypothetical protein